MKKLLTFSILGLLVCSLMAQEPLKRSAQLGIQLQAVPDSINIEGSGYQGGVFATTVFPNTTASALGLKDGDIIVEINDQPIHEPLGVVQAIQNFRAGDQIEVTALRSGKEFSAKGEMIGRPLETSEHGTVEYGQVDYDNTSLRSIMILPHGTERPPVVFFMQGYTCSTTEYPTTQDITIRRLIDDFVKAGYAVFRVDKPGVGDSKSDTPCQTTGFEVELQAFREGYRSLASRDDIDADNIFLFGHSMGGIVAPILAAEVQPKGVMTYGTAIKSWFEYMVDLARIQGELFGASFDEVELATRRAIPFHYDFLINKLPPTELAERHKEHLEQDGGVEQMLDGQYIGRHVSFWQSLNDQNITEAWLNYKGRVLAIYGEYDIQALNEDHVKLITRTVNSVHPGNASYAIIPKADHGFVRFDSMDQQMEVLGSGQYGRYLRSAYHEGIAEKAITWMGGVL